MRPRVKLKTGYFRISTTNRVESYALMCVKSAEITIQETYQRENSQDTYKIKKAQVADKNKGSDEVFWS